jgi:uncharacterized phage-associated protein
MVDAQDIHAVDVAQYILDNYGPMNTMKLQKLCYYVQAWSLAWNRGSVFPEPIEAWRRGPMIRSLFNQHRGLYSVSSVNGNASVVNANSQVRATIKDVVAFYLPKTGEELSLLTHAEKPWRDARARDSAADDDYSSAVISNDSLRDYYQSLMLRRSAGLPGLGSH